MLYEFKSKATGTVVMTAAVAERLLAIIGKPAGRKGIFTVEQMGPALAALQAAVDAEAANTQAEQSPASPAGHEDDHPAKVPHVTLRQRAWPLMDMMRTAQNKGKEITWGV
ncbi:MAG: DUF1840 domain-containing protein [Burkholderiales bacterium]|jgi:hypothetical protein